jgi:hypothetical protein
MRKMQDYIVWSKEVFALADRKVRVDDLHRREYFGFHEHVSCKRPGEILMNFIMIYK